MKTKQILSILCVVTMLFSLVAAFSSCAKEPEKPTTDTTLPAAVSETGKPEDTTAVKQYPVIPEGTNYNGEEFTILAYDTVKVHTWTDIPSDLYVEKGDGEVLTDAVYERNMKLFDTIGVKIVALQNTNADVTSKLNAAVSAQDPLYDAVIHCMNSMSTLFNKQLLEDYTNYDIDLSAPWWDKSSIESFTIGGKIFGAVGDATYMDKLSTIVTFFNKNYAQELGLGDFYQLVDSGEWTYDKMLEFGTKAKKLVGDTWDSDDSYGISCQNDGSYYLYQSANITVVRRDDEKGFVLAMKDEKSLSAIQQIFTLMNDKGLYYNSQVSGTTINETVRMFAENRSLFLLRPLQTLYELKSVDGKYGIIPMAKFYADQDNYHSPVNPYAATLFLLPVVVKDAAKTALVLDLLAAESHYSVMPVFYDVVLDVKLVDDPLVSKMLDIVFANRVYDLGLAWNFGGIRPVLVTANPDPQTITSQITRLEKPVEAAIKTLLDKVATFD